MERQKEEDKKRNRIIVILILLVIFLFIYIYLSKGWMGNEEEVILPVMKEYPIEQVEDIPVQTETVKEVVVTREDKVERQKEIKKVDQEDSNEEELAEEAEIIEEEVKPPANVKFGLAFSQRNAIWRKYQKRQTEIQEEANKLNEDRFSKMYLGHVEREMKKLTYNLKNEYKINTGQLDYIIGEGKNGKFNDAIQSF